MYMSWCLNVWVNCWSEISTPAFNFAPGGLDQYCNPSHCFYSTRNSEWGVDFNVVWIGSYFQSDDSRYTYIYSSSYKKYHTYILFIRRYFWNKSVKGITESEPKRSFRFRTHCTVWCILFVLRSSGCPFVYTPFRLSQIQCSSASVNWVNWRRRMKWRVQQIARLHTSPHLTQEESRSYSAGKAEHSTVYSYIKTKSNFRSTNSFQLT